ncbi:hypothetical protein ACFXHA_44395 [Nocardia sp. NPDC059240]|uniref:hypothetical protein n=1 Tax=Nocardia sp. NPDC059240 TaxID=3346786 RepID=UPI00367B026C
MGTDPHNKPARRTRSLLPQALTLVAASAAAVVMTLNAGNAAGETAAERCARETATYNSTWESTWRAANPGNPGPPPAPPVPYVCHDPGDQSTTTTTALPSTAPGLAPTQLPGVGVGGRAGNAPTSLPQGNGTDIVAGPQTSTRIQTPVPATANAPTSSPVPLPATTVSPPVSAQPVSGCGVDWHGPPCADIQDCPPGYALVDNPDYGQVCFQVEMRNPSYGDRSAIAGGATAGPLAGHYSQEVTGTATDTVSGSITKTDGTTQTLGTSTEVGVKGEAGIPLLANAEASAKITGSYQWAGTSQTADTKSTSNQYSTSIKQTFNMDIPPCTQLSIVPEYALLHWRIAQRYSWQPMGEGDMTHSTGRMKAVTDSVPQEFCN